MHVALSGRDVKPHVHPFVARPLAPRGMRHTTVIVVRLHLGSDLENNIVHLIGKHNGHAMKKIIWRFCQIEGRATERMP